MNNKIFFQLLACLILCSGCVGFIDNYGYFPNINKIKIGETKEQVKEKIGKPSYESQANENIWYYISTEIVRKIFYHKYSSKILTIEFDQEDKVKDFHEMVQKNKLMPNIKQDMTQGTGIAAQRSVKDRLVDGFKKLRLGF
ncbi:MAG: outer membrane protein assembly factor BamE [Rickettsiaceae bacterium H1]|nr:outer membrane protein assembly factor BamE [Rickettsiaceae bacterium H1]